MEISDYNYGRKSHSYDKHALNKMLWFDIKIQSKITQILYYNDTK